MASSIDDSLSIRVSSDCSEETRNILYHAWGHDLSELKTLLDDRGKASVQDPKTGETPLHAAIRACGPAPQHDEEDEGEDGEEDGSVELAKEILQELLFSGAIWNDVDANNETPGCVAHRLGRTSLYNMCVEAGVRAELLFAVMDGYEELSSGGEEEEEEREEDATDVDADAKDQDTAVEDSGVKSGNETTGANEDDELQLKFVPPDANEKPVTSEEYLESKLKYDDSKLLDSDLNGVMMAWETDIMRRSVAALIPDEQPGKRILNVGFGMGIIDGLFADLKPARHHIIEAHPSVLEHISKPESKFDSDWEKSGPEEGAYKVFAGKWQDVVLQLLERGEIYDAIYFDTFGEDYSQLRMFFMEYVTALLDQEGRFSFFNGLGADRKICYDVYTKVVEMHCADAGLDVEWEVSDVDMARLDEEGHGEWEGVRRRYWTLDKYRLPLCTFMG